MPGALSVLDDSPEAHRSPPLKKDEFGIQSGSRGGLGGSSKKPVNPGGFKDRGGKAARRETFDPTTKGSGVDIRSKQTQARRPPQDDKKKTFIKPGGDHVRQHKETLLREARQREIQEQNMMLKGAPSLEEARKVKKKQLYHDSIEDDDYNSDSEAQAVPALKKQKGNKGQLQLKIQRSEDESQEWLDATKPPQTGKKSKGGKRGLTQKSDSLNGIVKKKDGNTSNFYGNGTSSSGAGAGKKSVNDALQSTRSDGKRRKSAPVVPKIYDLVSDDEDDEAFLRATANDVYMTCDVNDPLDSVNGMREAKPQERRPETRPQTHFIRCTRVSRIYLGRKGYGQSNSVGDKDEARHMGVVAHESGIQIQEEFEGDRNKPSMDGMEAPLEERGVLIEPDKIEKVFVRAVEKQPASKYYFSVLLKRGDDNTIRSVYMGSAPSSTDPSSHSLDPNAVDGQASKYITVVVGTESAKEDHRNLEKSLTRMCSKNTIELVKTKRVDDKKFLAAAEAQLAMRQGWDATDESNMKRLQSRQKRRRRQSEPVAEIGRLDSDKDTYLVWPFGEEVTNSITITKGDKRRLGPAQYLNDSLIDFKIRYLDMQEFPARRDTWYAYSTFFYSRLASRLNQFNQSYKTVERWTKNVDIFAKELLVVPINEGEHWSVIFVLRPGLLVDRAAGAGQGRSKVPKNGDTPSSSPASQSQSQSQPSSQSSAQKEKGLTVEEEDAKQSPVLLFMDSLSYHNAKTVCNKIKRYLQYEYLSKKKGGREEDSEAFGLSLDEAKAKFPDVKAFCALATEMKIVQVGKRDLPTQENGFDCGMYLVKYVEYMLRMWPEPTKVNVDRAFKSVIFKKGRNEFTSDCIDTDRTTFQSILESLKPGYDDFAKEQLEKEVKEKRERLLKRDKEQKCEGKEKGEKENESGQQSASSSSSSSSSGPRERGQTEGNEEAEAEEEEEEVEDESRPRKTSNPYTVGPPAPVPAAAAEGMDVDEITLDGTDPSNGDGDATRVGSMDVEDTQEQSPSS